MPGLSSRYTFSNRVRYAETDAMGFVYHTHYLNYWEWTRTEWIRSTGYSYARLESEGYRLPCIHIDIRYHAPAKYDELVHTHMTPMIGGRSRLAFEYETVNDAGIRLVSGRSEHPFMDVNERVVRPPVDFMNHVRKQLNDDK